MLQEREDRLQVDRVYEVAHPVHLEKLVNSAGQPLITKQYCYLVTPSNDHILLSSSTWVGGPSLKTQDPLAKMKGLFQTVNTKGF